MSSRAVRVLFAAFVAASVAHIAIVVHHEPFAFDAWNFARDTHGEPITVGRFFAFWADRYTHSNPRFGEPFAYLAYKLVWFAPIVTPLVVLALAFAIATLGMARWPRLRDDRDLALLAFTLGALWFALPHLGMLLFCRAYCANYVYAAAIQLWFLVPLRLAGSDADANASWPRALAYGGFAIIAAMCNEHTGPTLCAFLILYTIVRYRRRAPSRLALAGAIGACIGFAAVFFAPGQAHRYDDLAQKIGFVDRLMSRAIAGNLAIFGDFLVGAAPVLALIALAVAAAASAAASTPAPPPRDRMRAALRFVAIALAAGAAITATVFVSPKLGARFYLHSCALLLAALVGVLAAAELSWKKLAPFVALALAAGVYAAAHTLPLYAQLSDDSDDRLAALADAPRGSVPTIEAFAQVEDDWWFLGDDLRDVRKRALIADYFDLAGVVLRGLDVDAPLGVTDVRLLPRGELTGAGSPSTSIDDYGGLDLSGYKGMNIASLHTALREAIAALSARLPAGTALARLDLEVAFAGERPALPRAHLYVARWRPDAMQAWTAAITRRSRSTVREVSLPADVKARPFEIYIYRVGGDAKRLGASRDDELTYTPWTTGAYWLLACEPDDCFVLAAVRQRS